MADTVKPVTGQETLGRSFHLSGSLLPPLWSGLLGGTGHRPLPELTFQNCESWTQLSNSSSGCPPHEVPHLSCESDIQALWVLISMSMDGSNYRQIHSAHLPSALLSYISNPNINESTLRIPNPYPGAVRDMKKNNVCSWWWWWWRWIFTECLRGVRSYTECFTCMIPFNSHKIPITYT